MLYIVHNFFQNFLAAVKADDRILLCDIIIDEIAKLIVFDRGKLIEAINLAKIRIRTKSPDIDIINALADNMSKNAKLRENVAKIIIDNNSDADNSGETVPVKERKDFILKALDMFVNSDNKMLLKKKVAFHSKVKDMNFAAEPEVIDLTKKKKAVIVLKTVLFTTGLIAIGLITANHFVPQGIFRKKQVLAPVQPNPEA